MLSVKPGSCIHLSPPSLETEERPAGTESSPQHFSVLRQRCYWIIPSAWSEDTLRALKAMKNMHTCAFLLVSGQSIHLAIKANRVFCYCQKGIKNCRIRIKCWTQTAAVRLQRCVKKDRSPTRMRCSSALFWNNLICCLNDQWESLKMHLLVLSKPNYLMLDNKRRDIRVNLLANSHLITHPADSENIITHLELCLLMTWQTSVQ